MEVIVATAVLAASGAALFALIGQASQLARRAEMRSEALQVAQSILDETLAMPGANQTEMSGTVESNPRWDFHIEQQPVDLPTAGADSIGSLSRRQCSGMRLPAASPQGAFAPRIGHNRAFRRESCLAQRANCGRFA